MSGWRTWVLRHLARRLHIGEDVLRHLSTFQRLGETLEVQAPREMLPVGARTLVRALRTRSAAQIRPDWLWPYWLGHQLDPESETFVPRGHLAFTTNLTHRNWTLVGNLWSPWEAIVDPTGLVTPWYDGWSLDWWVGTAEGWRFPSADPHVTQQLMEPGVPVVETALACGDGTVVQRVSAQVGSEEFVVVEVGNHSGRDIEIAFALRPYNPEGLAVVENIRLDGHRVLVDRHELALLLPGRPDRFALSTFARGDSRHAVTGRTAGGAGRGSDGATPTRDRTAAGPLSVRDPAGLAQAAFVYRLPAGAELRAAAPLLPGTEQRHLRRARDRVLHLRTTRPRLASATQVAASWKGVLARGMSVELPDARVQDAIDANRTYLRLLHDPGSITPGPFTYHRFWFRDAAYQLVALDRWGLHDLAADVLRTYPDRQRADGFFYSQWREWDANGAALWAIAEHHRLTGDTPLLRSLGASVARGAEWIDGARRRAARDADVAGLMPPGISAEHLGPYDYYYWDCFWSLRGLRDAAYVAGVLGDADGAARTTASARALEADLLASLEAVGRRLGRQMIPAGPRRGPDPGMVGSLVACEPLRLLEPHDPLVAGTLEVIRDRFCIGDAFYQAISHTGLGTYLTLQVAAVELARGDPTALRRLAWLLDAATPTYTWPEAIHPRSGGGCMGDGHHGWAAAEFLSFVREVLVRETRAGEVALLSLMPTAWHGGEIAVHDAPTRHGRVSYRLRWDGDVPVLSWECEQPGVTLTAPSVAPGWSTTQPRGRTSFESGDGGG